MPCMEARGPRVAVDVVLRIACALCRMRELLFQEREVGGDFPMVAQSSPWKAQDCREPKRLSSSARWARWQAFWRSMDSAMVAKRCWRAEGRDGNLDSLKGGLLKDWQCCRSPPRNDCRLEEAHNRIAVLGVHSLAPFHSIDLLIERTTHRRLPNLSNRRSRYSTRVLLQHQQFCSPGHLHRSQSA